VTVTNWELLGAHILADVVLSCLERPSENMNAVR